MRASQVLLQQALRQVIVEKGIRDNRIVNDMEKAIKTLESFIIHDLKVTTKNSIPYTNDQIVDIEISLVGRAYEKTDW